MAIELFAQLSTDSAATHTTNQPSEDGTREAADSDTKRSSKGADSRANLVAGECGICSSCSTTDRANNGSNLHGCSEGSDFLRVTTRAL